MRKVFVEVVCLNKPDGSIVPQKIVWEDGHVFEVRQSFGCATSCFPGRRRLWNQIYMQDSQQRNLFVF